LAVQITGHNATTFEIAADYGFDELFHMDDNIVQLRGINTASEGRFVYPEYAHGDTQHFIFDIRNGVRKSELRAASLPVERSLTSVIYHDIVMLLKPSRIELYDVSSLTAGHITPRNIDLLAHYRWRWPLDSVSFVIRSSLDQTSASYSSIDLLVRHSSTYPWPVNFLHRYTLSVNPDFKPDEPISWSQDVNNFPYIFPPFNTHTFASPVRLFAQTASVLGKFGTVLWLDSATEDYYGPSGDGQRLAGLVIPQDHDAAQEEPTQKQASSVFAKREHDAWVTLGLLEEYGLIAAGMKNGDVEVMSFT
jgi:hypothetical protein